MAKRKYVASGSTLEELQRAACNAAWIRDQAFFTFKRLDAEANEAQRCYQKACEEVVAQFIT